MLDGGWIVYLDTDFTAVPFWKHMGIYNITELGPGNVRLRMKVKDELLNLYGNLHGGATASLIDCALGTAIATLRIPDTRVVTVEMKVNYISAVSPDSEIEAEARVVNRGKTLVVGKVEVKNPDGDLVAFGTGTYMQLRTS